MGKIAKIIVIASLSAMVVAAVPITTAAVVLGESSLYEDTYLAGLKLKRDLLNQKDRKRLIFIGGSSLPFGLRSELIEKELPEYHVVNFGLYGALGTECMLDLALPYIQDEDLVLLSFEQNKQTLSSYFSGHIFLQAANDCKDAFFDLDERDRNAVLGSGVSFAQEKFSYWSASSKPQGDGAYQKQYFEAHGDLVYDGASGNAMAERYDPNQLVSFDVSWWEESFIKEVNWFTEEVQKKGAKTYYWFAPINQKSVQNLYELDDYCVSLAEKIKCPILGDPHASVFDEGYFFDSNFHLNNAGANNNTRRFVRDYKAEFGITSKTNIEVMDIPSAIVPEVEEGDNSDRACFVVESKTDHAVVTGLSKEGLKRSGLILPATENGLPITEFSVSTFQNNSVIESIRLQNNLRAIPDYAFSGATNLKRIELTSLNPATYQIGSHLLDGTDADIYVPKEAVGRYRSHYFFSIYSSRIREM